MCVPTNDQVRDEAMVISQLCIEFRQCREVGREYFEGDRDRMVDVIYELVKNARTSKSVPRVNSSLLSIDDFANECIEKKQGEMMRIDDAYNELKAWRKSKAMHVELPNYNDFIKWIEQSFGGCVTIDGNLKILGCTLRFIYTDPCFDDFF